MAATPPHRGIPGAVVLAALAAIQGLGGLLGLGRNLQTYLVVAFVAFGVFEAISIVWASDKGIALDTTNQTLVYALVLLVFRRLDRRRSRQTVARSRVRSGDGDDRRQLALRIRPPRFVVHARVDASPPRPGIRMQQPRCT